MTWLLGFGIPIAYIALGTVMGILVHDGTKDWHTDYCHERMKRQDASCDCSPSPYPFIAGGFWPVFAIILSVWVVMKGRKQPKKTRLGRAQRKARKVQEYIDQLEKDLGLVDDK